MPRPPVVGLVVVQVDLPLVVRVMFFCIAVLQLPVQSYLARRIRPPCAQCARPCL